MCLDMTDIPTPSWESDITSLDVSFPLSLTDLHFNHNLNNEIVFSRLLVKTGNGINEGFTFEGTSYNAYSHWPVQGFFMYKVNDHNATIHIAWNTSEQAAFFCLGRIYAHTLITHMKN